jgi:hypothetical protein
MCDASPCENARLVGFSYGTDAGEGASAPRDWVMELPNVDHVTNSQLYTCVPLKQKQVALISTWNTF